MSSDNGGNLPIQKPADRNFFACCLPVNIDNDVSRLQRTHSLPDARRREQAFAQLDNCEWLKLIVLIALHTGMRGGEICNLQWFDLNFDRELICNRPLKHRH